MTNGSCASCSTTTPANPTVGPSSHYSINAINTTPAGYGPTNTCYLCVVFGKKFKKDLIVT